MSRRDTAVHYLLEHRLALLLAGFVVLLDLVGTDWVLQHYAAGTATWLRAGALGSDLVPVAGWGVLALTSVLVAVGGAGLWRRAARTRLCSGAPCGAASELLVLAGALAMVLNVALHGRAILPVTLAPFGLPVGPGLLVAVLAAMWLAFEALRDVSVVRTA